MKEDKKIVCPSVSPEKLAELSDLKEKLDSLPHDARGKKLEREIRLLRFALIGTQIIVLYHVFRIHWLYGLTNRIVNDQSQVIQALNGVLEQLQDLICAIG